MSTARVYEMNHGTMSIKVTDTDGVRTLWINGVPQSQMLLEKPFKLITDYEEVMASWVLFLSEQQLSNGQVLALGLGGGSAIRHLKHYFPKLVVTAVENSDAIATVAYEYFELPKSSSITVCIEDAFSAVSTPNQFEDAFYDLLLIDLFDPELQATYQFEKIFWEDCLKRMATDGVLAVNLWATHTSTFETVLQQIGEVFNWRVLLLPVEGFNNVILFAFHPAGHNHVFDTLEKRAETYAQQMDLPFQQYLEQLVTQNHLQVDRCINLDSSVNSVAIE